MSAQLCWWRANTQNFIFLNLINSVDNTKLSWYTLPSRQHHSFFRKLPLLFIYNYQKSTRIKKQQQQQQKPPWFTKADQMSPSTWFQGQRWQHTHDTPTHHVECPLFLQHLLTAAVNIKICNISSKMYSGEFWLVIDYAGFPPQGISL